MASYKIFFPMVRTAKSQLTGDGGGHTEKANKPKRQAPKWVNVDGSPRAVPTYKTQAEVTNAIAAGTLKRDTLALYDLAKEYEKFLKLLAQWDKGFVPNAPKPRANGIYNHTMGFSR